jgi:phytoene dehydrogenase-like protein
MTALVWKSRANPHAHDDTDGPADEDAYRRGFQQGAEEALRALDRGTPRARLKRWQTQVYDWRFLKSHKRRTPPPQAPRHPIDEQPRSIRPGDQDMDRRARSRADWEKDCL